MKAKEKLEEESAEGVQRIPKYKNRVAETVSPLVGAGQAEDSSIPTMPGLMTLEQMKEDCVLISDGSLVGFLSDPRYVFSLRDFDLHMADSVTKVKDKNGNWKPAQASKAWRAPGSKPTRAFTRTFRAGAGPVCGDPSNRLALNAWRPIERWPPKVNIQRFLDHVAYLFPDEAERERFLDWLAHIEQYPGVLPHAGWLHIALNTGTGRSWLAGVLKKVWRGYSASVDLPKLLDSSFNDMVAGKIFAIVEEVQEGAGENRHKHANKLKDLVTEEHRNINPKYGKPYTEYNACRWLAFSNHDNALPLDNTDRRWHVTRHTAEPLDEEYYKKLYAWSDNPESANAIGWYLSKRDISKFNPGEKPEVNDAKKTVINASKNMIKQYAQELVEDYPADIIINAAIADVLSEGKETVCTDAMRRALEDLGCVRIPKQLRVGEVVYRCWILRNSDEWLAKAPYERAQEVAKGIPGEDRTAREILAGKKDIPF